MKNVLLLILILLLVAPLQLFSEPLKGYEPYEEGEFPLWTYSIRRAETIFFGSMVLTIPVSILIHTVARSSGIIGPQTNELNDVLSQVAIASALSLGVTITDWALGLGK